MVLQLHLPPKYILDEMTEYEYQALMDNAELGVDKANLELLRTNAYITASASGAKIKLTDIAQFPWDDEVKEKKVTAEDRRALADKAQLYKRYLNGNTD